MFDALTQLILGAFMTTEWPTLEEMEVNAERLASAQLLFSEDFSLLTSAELSSVGQAVYPETVEVLYSVEELMQKTDEKLYSVVAVIDGDTLIVADPETRENFQVRLLAVDTQELNGLDSAAECGGHEALVYTTEFLETRLVRLRADLENEDEDPLGRKLRYVDSLQWNGSFINLNKALVEEGYASFPSQYPITYTELFSALEENAKDNDLGMWGLCSADEIDLF